MGLCVADELGVTIEFMSREKFKMNPVIGMRGLGTHNQSVVSWKLLTASLTKNNPLIAML